MGLMSNKFKQFSFRAYPLSICQMRWDIPGKLGESWKYRLYLWVNIERLRRLKAWAISLCETNGCQAFKLQTPNSKAKQLQLFSIFQMRHAWQLENILKVSNVSKCQTCRYATSNKTSGLLYFQSGSTVKKQLSSNCQIKHTWQVE